MAIQIITTVDKADVAIQKKYMYGYVDKANSIDGYSTYKALNEAYRALNIATGFYKALDGLRLLEEGDMVGEDIIRIEKKINDILEEKRRKDMPKWAVRKAEKSC